MRAAEAASVSVRTLSRWLRCYRRDGEEGLLDRSSVPRLIAHRTPEQRLQAIAALRWLRLRAAQSGEALSMPRSTVSALLRRVGLGRLSRLEPPEPAKRYECRGDGELPHTGVKKLGRPGRPGDRVNGDRRTRRRGIGWEFVHVCVDDATRLADVEVGEEEKATSAVGLLRRALAHLRAHGIRIERVMSDNGSAYVSAVHALACKTLGIKHLRTRPYPPRTNGKAERFIRTLLGGWAYGAIYGNCQERRLALTGWLDFSNRRRPHGSLNHQPPLRRLEALTRNNLAGSCS